MFAVFVAFQLAIPLTYYARDDRYDERFAWRMFSAIRVETCATSAHEVISGEVRPVDLEHSLHRAWIEHFERNRRAVILRYLERRCSDGAASAVAIDNECVDARGSRLPTRHFERVCASGAERMSTSRGEP